MNRYIAKTDLIMRTKSGKRVSIIEGQEYDGGYDFRNHPTNKSVIFVMIDGIKDEIEFPAGEEFISKFKFAKHVDNIRYSPVQIHKRKRNAGNRK